MSEYLLPSDSWNTHNEYPLTPTTLVNSITPAVKKCELFSTLLDRYNNGNIPERIIDLYRRETQPYIPSTAAIDTSLLKELLLFSETLNFSPQVSQIISPEHAPKSIEALYRFKSDIEWLVSLIWHCENVFEYQDKIDKIFEIAFRISLGNKEKRIILEMFKRMSAQRELRDI